MNEHTAKNLLVRVGQRHNRQYVVLYNYDGPTHISPALHEAILRRLDEKFKGQGWKWFDYIEVVQDEI